MKRLEKFAAVTIEMGDPKRAGESIAEIIKFLTSRIDPSKRYDSINKLRNKIINLNEHDIAAKQTPPTASLGQSISFVKTILIGHDPAYIREILANIYYHLG